VKRITRIAVLLLVVVMAGCATNKASHAPDADLHKLKTFYVARLPADENGVEKLIAKRLNVLGYQCTSGDAQTPATPVDAVVTYQDRWMWDITMYMLELTINFRDPKSDFPIATGNSFHTSLTRKSPEEMVDEVLSNILAAPKQ